MTTGTRKSTAPASGKKTSAPAKKASVPAKKAAAPAKKVPAAAKKPAAAVPAKRAVAAVPAKKIPAGVPAKSSAGREAMLARVESVRMAQRAEGHFDCFGRAGQGYCDQGDCAYHAECLSVSGLLHSL